MKTAKRQLGDAGEALAAQFLEQKGCVILARNFCAQGGEIDIIAEKDQEIIFVEVKTRQNETFGHAIESITPKKIARLQIAAWKFLEKNELTHRDFRFDIITITRGKIEHFENAISEA